MRRLIFIVAIVGAALVAIAIWQPWAMRKPEWIQKTVAELQHDTPPPSGATNYFPIAEWVLEEDLFRQHGYLTFSNGWACLRFHTIHNQGKVGDVAVLRSSDGSVYVSDFHFCGGLLDFSGQRQPRDLAEFLELYEPKQHWKKDA